MKVVVLRLGHRKERDKRVTTHCALVARAWGASEIIVCGEEDPQVKKSVEGVVKKWGGDFKISFAHDWKKELKKAKKKFKIVHLTFYGKKLAEGIREIKEGNPARVMVVVGASKVPREVYSLADINLSVGNQPHSEIAALAIVLDKILEKDLYSALKNAKIRIKPTEKGKTVENV